MQPLDLRFFATLKQQSKAALRSFQLENIGEFVNKRNFARVFKSAWEKSTSIEVAIKGFMEAGLFPLCPEQVTKSVKLESSRLFVPVQTGETTVADTVETNIAENEISDAQGATVDKAAPDSGFIASSEPSGNATSKSKAPESPFSKFLKYPEIQQSKGKKKKSVPMPKAITGRAYRELLIEKKEQKEQEQKGEKNEERRLSSSKGLKRRDKKQKKIQREEAMLERRRKKAAKVMEKALASDSDDCSEAFIPGKCYWCEKDYYTEFIECEKCFKRFHIACAQDEIIDGIPFECAYC